MKPRRNRKASSLLGTIQDVLGRLLGPTPVQPTRRSPENNRPARTRMPDTPYGLAYQLKLTVVDAPRPVWRRVRVHGDVSIRTLNQYIRRAFGWDEERSYKLRMRRPWTAEPKANRERRVSLCELVSHGDALSFIYRDGHGWEVHALVEETGPRLKSLRPTCIDGGGANLPANPDHPWLPPQIREEARRRRPAIRSEAGEPIDIEAVTACMQRRPVAQRATEPSAVATAPAVEPAAIAAAEPAVADDRRCCVCQRPAPKLRQTACCGRIVCFDKGCGRHERHGLALVRTDTPRR